jgi:hypothetical protein
MLWASARFAAHQSYEAAEKGRTGRENGARNMAGGEARFDFAAFAARLNSLLNKWQRSRKPSLSG